MNPVIQLKQTTAVFLVGFGLASFGLSSVMLAVNPAPDGSYNPPQGYGVGNTAEGTNALLSLSTGTFNTAVGYTSLLSGSDFNYNTAVGASALLHNIADFN